jgi:hypothetical protein
MWEAGLKPGREREANARAVISPHVQASAPRPVRSLLASATLEKPLIREFLFYPPYPTSLDIVGQWLMCCAGASPTEDPQRQSTQTTLFVYSRAVLYLSSADFVSGHESVVPKVFRVDRSFSPCKSMASTKRIFFCKLFSPWDWWRRGYLNDKKERFCLRQVILASGLSAVSH